MKSNFAPWTDAVAPSSAADAGGADALQRAAEELTQAVARLAEMTQQSASPVAIQITVSDGSGNSLPFTTPDGPDLSLFS